MYFRSLIGVGLTGLLAAYAVAQEARPKPKEAAADDTAERVRHIDARADQRVKAMSDFLAKQQKFQFSVEITYDAVEADGQKVQLGRRSHAEVLRPNSLRVDSQGDRGWDQLTVYDGKHFLLHNRAQNVYSRVETPPTFEQFFQFLFDEYGVSPPLVDFLLPDVHGSLTGNAESGALLGPALVADKPCDHIAFSGELLDWQIWIEQGETPWPRKFVITYKDVDVRPQFMAVFRKWETGISLDGSRFSTAAPSDATEVPLERVVENAADNASDESGKGD